MRTLSTVIVFFKTAPDVARACVQAVRHAAKRADARLEFVLVDNGDGEIFEILAPDLPENTQTIATHSNLGFGSAVNIGLAAASGGAVLLLNPDAIVSERALDAMLSRLEKPGRRLVGGWLVNGDTVQLDAYTLWFFSTERQWRRRETKRLVACASPGEALPVRKLCGGALMGTKDVFDEVGAFDESFFLYGEDVDYSLRATRAGIDLEVLPEAVVDHQAASSAREHGVLVEQARVDAALRLVDKYHRSAVTALAMLELACYSLVGALLPARTSSRSRSNRLARFRELRRWLTLDLPPARFDPDG